MKPFINHYRYHWQKDKNVNNPTGIAPRGGLTVAVITTEEGMCRWGFSKCHSHDSFRKDLGRIRAIGRATSKSALITDGMEIKGIKEIADKVAIFIMRERVMPEEQAQFESIIGMERISNDSGTFSKSVG